MAFLELSAPAKINLSLDVLYKRTDGYHQLKMIMQSLGIYDIITLKTINNGIYVECDCEWVSSGTGNIAYKAADLIFKKFGIKYGLRINIKKKIPVAAGLAGGSADAAAVLRGINRMYSLGLDTAELMRLGKQLGADIPFCIGGGTMLAEGIGEILTKLEPFENVNVVLIKPKCRVSTAWAFGNLDIGKIRARPDTSLIIKAISKKDIKSVAEKMTNVLEVVTIQKYQVVRQAKEKLVELGAMGSMMSGSGPSVFGIFADREIAEKAYFSLEDKRWDCFLTKTVRGDEY